ncbi:ATP-binding protein [Streptomyces sp. NPDC050161]|uniref:ATP-binding protein n=1 Tax=Streptomyces sp. NPDC050161 TaxID=3365604 RepID=UPI00379E896E
MTRSAALSPGAHDFAACWSAVDPPPRQPTAPPLRREEHVPMTATKSTAIGVPGYSQTYPREAASSGKARRLTSTALRTWNVAPLTDDAELVTAELVNNAVQHGTGHSLRVSIKRISASRVRIAVTDRSLRLPAIRHPDVEDVAGRGLLLVVALSARWGTDIRGWGKVVWAELSLTEVAL